MASPKRDNPKAARALVDAALSTDAQACEKHGMSLRTLQNYRVELRRDAELARIYEDMRKLALAGEWSENLNLTLNASILKLMALIQGAQSSDPETITSVTHAVLGMAETAMTRDLLAARMQESESQLSPRSALVHPQPQSLN
jgi:hypothetical protein